MGASFIHSLLLELDEGDRRFGVFGLTIRLHGKLEGTEADTQNPSFSPENFIAEMHNWSLVSMAVSVRAKAEAQRDCRTLSICQQWINQQNIAHRPCRNGSGVSFTCNAKITKHLPFLHRNACCFFLQAPTALQVFKLKCHEYECLRQVGCSSHVSTRLHCFAKQWRGKQLQLSF